MFICLPLLDVSASMTIIPRRSPAPVHKFTVLRSGLDYVKQRVSFAEHDACVDLGAKRDKIQGSGPTQLAAGDAKGVRRVRPCSYAPPRHLGDYQKRDDARS